MTAVLKPGEAHASSDLEELRRNLRQLEEAHDIARKEFDDTKLEYAGIVGSAPLIEAHQVRFSRNGSLKTALLVLYAIQPTEDRLASALSSNAECLADVSFVADGLWISLVNIRFIQHPLLYQGD